MDIAKQLQAYEVEYHVLKEEMMYSPQKGENDLMQKLEQANHTLKQQNMELIEKLQQAHSHERSLESLINNYQTQETKLKSHIRTLEIERAALLNAVAKLKHLVPESDQLTLDLDLSLPDLAPSLAQSPVHHGTVLRDGALMDNGCDVDVRCSVKTERNNSAKTEIKVDLSKSARYHPERNS